MSASDAEKAAKRIAAMRNSKEDRDLPAFAMPRVSGSLEGSPERRTTARGEQSIHHVLMQLRLQKKQGKLLKMNFLKFF